MIFPTVHGENLSGRVYTVPFSLEGEYNLLMVAFEPSQQFLLRTWVPFLMQLVAQYRSFRYYELPTLGVVTQDQRQYIDHAMRRNILDPNIRDLVITLYVDKVAFCKALDLRSETTIYLFLIDHEGEILWRAEGIATPYKKEELTRTLLRLFNTNDTPLWEV